jgi:hypothetical protein
MKEWLLLVALRVHFRSLLYSLRRIRKPEVTHRFHFRFVDPIPDMRSLLPPLRGVGYQLSVRQNDADFRREDGAGKQGILPP